MAVIRQLNTNFTAGELSPEISLGRMDVQKYNNGVARMENCKIKVQGGASRRPGTRYVGTTKFPNKISRIVSFIYSRTQAYIIELGDQYASIIKNRSYVLADDAVTRYELSSPYTSSQLLEIDYAQKFDTVFYTHEAVYPQRMQRYSDNKWNMINVPFITAPFDEVGDFPTGTLTLSALTGSGVTATAATGYFLAADEGRTISYNAGLATIVSVTSPTVITVDIVAPFQSLVMPSTLWNVQGSPNATITPNVAGPAGNNVNIHSNRLTFRTGDIGKFMVINGGLIEITGYVDSENMTGFVRNVMTGVVGSPPYAWTLESSIWTNQFGYPRTPTISKQRLFFAGTTKFPLTIWGSQIQGYLNFQFGTKDDDAFRFELDSFNSSPIGHLVPSRQLLVMTDYSEMTIFGGTEKPITPTNIQKVDQSATGSSFVRPVQAGTEILFVQSAGKKIHAIGYRYENDAFNSPDRTIFSSHITGPGISDMAYQKNPQPTIYAVRKDGQMAVAAYDIDQEVTGWNRWITDGSFESVATVPFNDVDDTYVSVKRTINGQDIRYIEVFDDDVYLDCAYVGTSIDPKTNWSGFPWLEGKDVHVRADGYFAGTYTVNGGSITLAVAASDVQIGLPFTSVVEPNQPAIDGPNGTTVGSQLHLNEITLRVLNTSAAVINDKEIDFRKFGNTLLDQPLPTISGDIRTPTLQDEIYNTKCEISQPYPLPFQILDIIRKVSVN